MEVEQTRETLRVHHINYVRNARAVGVLWGFFTVCFAIINIVVFIQPQWIGDTIKSSQVGFFGLYEYCIFYTGQSYYCQGSFHDFNSIRSTEFKVATLFVGISALLTFVCILCFVLFMMIRAGLVYMICGWIQLFCGVLMALGCLIYPAGWDHQHVKDVCGDNAGPFILGSCEIRYAYILAIIAIFDAIILAILAFVLATRQADKKLDYIAGHPGGLTKSEINTYMLETESKPSIAIQPVLSTHSEHGADRFSEYTTASKRSKHDFAL